MAAATPNFDLLSSRSTCSKLTYDGRVIVVQMNAFVTVTYLVLFSSFFYRRYIAPAAAPTASLKPIKTKSPPKLDTEKDQPAGDATAISKDQKARRRSQRLASRSS